MAKIVCVGLACLDYLFRITALPTGGGKFFATDYIVAPGGPAAAASLAVAALGHEASFLGRLGNDPVGQDIVRHLSHHGVDTRHMRMIDDQTSQVSAVIIDNTGERLIINYSSSQLDPDPSWLPKETIGAADFLLTDVRWPAGARAALQIAREHGVKSLIDADVAPVDITDLAAMADYAVCSERGLEQISGQSDIEKGLRTAAEKLQTWVAVTAGEHGSFWLEGERLCSCPAEKIEPVDTCGAGDIFHGAFAVAMAEKMAIRKAIRFSGAAAAIKCTSFGGSLGAPSRDDVEKLLHKIDLDSA